jgi:lysophospholipase L1-like esterase
MNKETSLKTKQIFTAHLIFTTLAILALTAAPSSSATQTADHWVGTWATSAQSLDPTKAPPNAAPPPAFADATLRQIVHVSIGGQQIRVRFSNEFGSGPLVISSAHVALSVGPGAIKPESDKALTFDGQPSVSIPPGAPMVSDPLDFNLASLSDVVISIHLTSVPDIITTHPGSRATSYLQTGDAVSVADLSQALHFDRWYFLSGIDVMASNSSAAVVTFGDSITDGAQSTTNANARWPDELARRLQANKKTASIAVLNEGIGGNRLLHDMTGANALARLDRDVLAQSGVRWIIILEGINDIGGITLATQRHELPPSAEDVIAAYEQIIARAHAHNIRVYGATILPFEGAHYYSADGETERQKVNNWIRTSGKFDAVIDLDAATRDAKDPAHLIPIADSGDHLHPPDAGYKLMGDTVDLKLFGK